MAIQHPDIEVVAACRDKTRLLPGYSGEVREGDLRDPDYLDRVLAGIDIICHAAGWSSFENTGEACNRAYLEPTIDLINHAIEWRVSRFVNLSSLYVTQATQRNDAEACGHPRAFWPMINCLIAVEDYLRNLHSSNRCQFINLRLGLYAGRRLHLGLLPLLLARSGHGHMPYITGQLGHLPLVDGRDIGQAFVRAALAPIDAAYSCFNISGPDTPTQAQVMEFIHGQLGHAPLRPGLPRVLASPVLWLQGKLFQQNGQPMITRPMMDMLLSPGIDTAQSRGAIGYDPETSWQASLLDTLESHKNQSLVNRLSDSLRNLDIH